MKTRISLYVVAAALILGGCATPQRSINLKAEGLAAKEGRIGVAMTALPKVDTYFPGADCLLCIAIVSAANSSLTKHTHTLPYEDLMTLKNTVAEALRNRGAEVMVISDSLDLKALPDADKSGPDLTRKNFSSLQNKYGIDKLVVLQITSLGMKRTYSSYFPTSDPKAYMSGIGYMVNLKTNGYEWYMPLDILKSTEGKWDEPPAFPGLTNAYFQVLELGKDGFLKPFNDLVVPIPAQTSAQ